MCSLAELSGRSRSSLTRPAFTSSAQRNSRTHAQRRHVCATRLPQLGKVPKTFSDTPSDFQRPAKLATSAEFRRRHDYVWERVVCVFFMFDCATQDSQDSSVIP